MRLVAILMLVVAVGCARTYTRDYDATGQALERDKYACQQSLSLNAMTHGADPVIWTIMGIDECLTLGHGWRRAE